MQVKGDGTRSRRRGAGGDFRAAGLVALTLTLVLVVPVVPGSRPSALAQAPGPELFAKEPRTPLELWDAVDYLLRTDQAKKAVPYLDKFMKSQPDDATWIAIRNRYGPGSILRLNDDAATRPFAKPLAEAMVAAARKYATRPERIARFITELTRTPKSKIMPSGTSGKQGRMPCRFWWRRCHGLTSRPRIGDSWSATSAGWIVRRSRPWSLCWTAPTRSWRPTRPRRWA